MLGKAALMLLNLPHTETPLNSQSELQEITDPRNRPLRDIFAACRHIESNIRGHVPEDVYKQVQLAFHDMLLTLRPFIAPDKMHLVDFMDWDAAEARLAERSGGPIPLTPDKAVLQQLRKHLRQQSLRRCLDKLKDDADLVHYGKNRVRTYPCVYLSKN